MLPWVFSVSHRSQMTSKCEKKNKEVARAAGECVIHSFIHYDSLFGKAG